MGPSIAEGDEEPARPKIRTADRNVKWGQARTGKRKRNEGMEEERQGTWIKGKETGKKKTM